MYLGGYKMSKILIVGKNSYVGTSVKNYFSINYPNDEVVLISSRNDTWCNYDFSKYDAIFNVSGLCHADSKHGTPDMYMNINADLPLQIATKAKQEGVKLFINMSSMIVYGNMSNIGTPKEIAESTIPTPINIYGLSKLQAEQKLQQLEDYTFHIAHIRSPLIYGENAKDNFPRLVKFAKTMPIFPNISNAQSMIYIDNFCELIHLIVVHNKGGIYRPQDKEYISTSKLVKDIATASNKKIFLTKFFNPFISLLSKKIYFFNKVFGNITYTQTASNHFDYKYCVVDYNTAINRIANPKKL